MVRLNVANDEKLTVIITVNWQW